MTYAQLTLESFHRKLSVFGLTLNNREDINKYSYVTLSVDSKVDFDAINEIYLWLDKNFGDNWIWSTDHHTDSTSVYFMHAEDALMFKLKFKTA